MAPDSSTPVEESTARPLLAPRDGVPAPVTSQVELEEYAAALGRGTGPVAIDTERASGFRYAQRAYLLQFRRTGASTALVDPIAVTDLAPLARALAGTEWVLHAASQDLPCLAELNLRPDSLFDTELAGRLAGLPRVGLGPLVEQILGLHLAKGHGADDWSRRPLPESWLNYAALDVEVLIELRDAMSELLAAQRKSEWAAQEFAALAAAPPPEPRVDPWRRTSGIHGITDRRVLAAVRELWTVRDEIASHRDLAPHRVLPDHAIIDAATANPESATQLTKLPVFSGRNQQRYARRYFEALQRARALPQAQLPPRRLPHDGPPPASRWAHKDPDAAARLAVAREGLTALSEQVTVPVENLTSPRLVRDILWHGPSDESVANRLRDGGARPWQIELVTPIIDRALTTRP